MPNSGHDDDERQLANLILLLRNLPQSSSGADDTVADATVDPAVAALQTALERKDCQLLRFMDRLVRQYYEHANNNETVPVDAAEEGSEISSANYAYLRLAVRIASLRYYDGCSSGSHDGDDGNGRSSSNNNKRAQTNAAGRVWKCEYQLLMSLVAAVQVRPIIIDDTTFAMELTWAVGGLLDKLSSSSASGSNTTSSITEVLWNKAVHTLLQYRRCVHESRGEKTGVQQQTLLSHVEEGNMTDRQMMIQTIHSILDRSTIGPPPADWELQLDASLLSCLTSFLTRCETMVEQQGHGMPKLTQDVLFGLIQWSQENHPFSFAVYVFLEKYIRLCTEREGGDDDNEESLACFQTCFVLAQTSSENAPQTKTRTLNDRTKVEFAFAMRSFLFYVMIVLCNTDHPGESFLKTFKTDISIKDKSATTIRRGNVLSLILDLWSRFGVDWLLVSHSNMSGAASSFWWLQSEETNNDQQHNFGPTWPLCMLVRLAVGEFRLGLGRYLSYEENGGIQKLYSYETDCSGLVADITVCSRFTLQSRDLMTSMVDDDGDVAIVKPWNPDAVLHIRTSLEDALNSSVQYLTTFPGELNSSKYHPLPVDDGACPLGNRDSVEIWFACCLVTGSIADDLDVDQLLVMSSAENIGSHQTHDDDSNMPSFILALRGGIQFSNSLAERQFLSGASCQESLEIETLVYLLPSTVSLVQHVAFNDDDEVSSNMAAALEHAKQAFCEDDWLMITISMFLRRLSHQWSVFCRVRENTIPSLDSLVNRRTFSVVGIVDMCIVLVSSLGYIASSTMKTNYSTLSKRVGLNNALDQWKKNLECIVEWSREDLKCNATETLKKVAELLSFCA